MKQEKLLLLFASVVVATLFSCKNDDTPDVTEPTIRDAEDVYKENTEAITTYFKTHTFNYEDFDFEDKYAKKNDTFKLQFRTLKTKQDSLRSLYYFLENDSLFEIKKVKGIGDVEYDLHILKLREGKGDRIHALDNAVLNYKGILLDGEIFDDRSLLPVSQDLTRQIAVKGYSEAIVSFKTATDYSERKDGSIIYKDYGIGAVFIPSGLAYFQNPPLGSSIPLYAPLIFAINVLGRTYTDYDTDSVPSYIENGLQDGDYIDTDSDGVADVFDADDDNDGVFTRAEVSREKITGTSLLEVESKASNLPKHKFLVSTIKVDDTLYEGTVIIFNDKNSNGIYDHLDVNYP